MAKLKTESCTIPIGEALGDAQAELQALSEEMCEWRDNMEGTGLENTSKFEEVQETADSLENLSSTLDGVDLGDYDVDEQIEFSWSHPYGKHLGRSWRAVYISTLLEAIAAKVDDDTANELQEVADELGAIDFPGMF